LQLEIERADREEIKAELSPAKAKFCSGRHSFRKINTRRGHNSQPARPPGTKNLPQRGRDVEKILGILEANPEN
jgi:hypothetical protein